MNDFMVIVQDGAVYTAHLVPGQLRLVYIGCAAGEEAGDGKVTMDKFMDACRAANDGDPAELEYVLASIKPVLSWTPWSWGLPRFGILASKN